MNFNQFYRKKDRAKRRYTPEEKRNLRKIVLTYCAFIAIGCLAGLLLILALR